jgi:hypothetical protein
MAATWLLFTSHMQRVPEVRGLSYRERALARWMAAPAACKGLDFTGLRALHDDLRAGMAPETAMQPERIERLLTQVRTTPSAGGALRLLRS